jgi:ADP-heptose:LPS heptosyltransferase
MTTLGRGSSLPGILIIHPGSLGDVLLARAAIRAVRSRFPGHRLALIAAEQVGRLLLESAEVDRLFPLERGYLGILFGDGDNQTKREFFEWLSTCQNAIGWLRDEGGRIEATLRRIGVGSIVMRSPSIETIRAIHQASRFLEAIGGDADRRPTVEPLHVPSFRKERGAVLLRELRTDDRSRCVAVHVGSGSRHKCLDSLLMAQVIDGLSKDGNSVFLVSGEADWELTDAVRRQVRYQIPLLSGLDLPTVAGLLSQVSLFLGHDSGLTHLAASLTVPVVACFGPTDPKRWGPSGTTTTVLVGEPCTCKNWAEIRECREKRCLRISPERIIEACRNVLMAR